MKEPKPLYSSEMLMNSLASARELVPLLIDLFQPNSVVDVGCGLGVWLSVFKQCQTSQVLGIDSLDCIDAQKLMITSENFLNRDLTKLIDLKQSFDLALCLEVAEHLPEDNAQTLIKSLTKLSNIIVFSAAVPNQGGVHHINEQWANYWLKLFQQEGYEVLDCLRPRIWNNPNIEPWYKQNLLVFVAPQLMSQVEKLLAAPSYHHQSVIHPELWTRVLANKNAEIAILKRQIVLLKEEQLGVKNAVKNLWSNIKKKFLG